MLFRSPVSSEPVLIRPLLEPTKSVSENADVPDEIESPDNIDISDDGRDADVSGCVDPDMSDDVDDDGEVEEERSPSPHDFTQYRLALTGPGQYPNFCNIIHRLIWNSQHDQDLFRYQGYIPERERWSVC